MSCTVESEEFEVNVSPIITKLLLNNYTNLEQLINKLDNKIDLLSDKVSKMEININKITSGTTCIQQTCSESRDMLGQNRELYGKELECIKKSEEKTRQDIIPILDSIYNKSTPQFDESRVYNRFWRSANTNVPNSVILLDKPFIDNL